MQPKTSAVVSAPQFPELAQKSSPWTALAAALTVDSQETMDEAAQALGDIVELEREIQSSTRPVITAAHAAHQAAINQEKQLLSPLMLAKAAIKTKISTYVQRIERERNRQAALEAATRKAELERAAEEAKQFEEAGEPEMAEAILEEAELTTAPPVVAPLPKSQGVSIRSVWKFEVTNLMQLVKAVAKGKVPVLALQANDKFLGEQARSMKNQLSIPGVRAFEEKGVATR